MNSGRLNPLLRKAKRDGWSDWIRCDADERAVLDGCYFDRDAVDHVESFFASFLKHSKGQWAKQPFVLADWQRKNVIGPLFGWKRSDGLRRFRTSYIEIPKKNGKSTLASGIGLYMFIADGEGGAEVYSAATKMDQASIVHQEAINMVKSSVHLFKRVNINHATRVMSHGPSASKYKVLAHDAGGAEGLNIHCIIADELHVWKGRRFYDSLRYGTAVRDQPLFFMITTAGEYDTGSIGFQEHQYALDVIAGEVNDPEYYAFVTAADPECEITDPEAHKQANPSYGITIKPDEMINAAEKASRSKSLSMSFKRYRLNLWTEDSQTAFDMTAWRQAGGDVDERSLEGRACYGGLDLAATKDTCSLLWLFPPEDENGRFDVLLRCWTPRAYVENPENKYGKQMIDWADQGGVTICDDDVIDYAQIKAQMIQDIDTFRVTDIGADRWNCEAFRQDVLMERDVEFVWFGQGFRDMSEPLKRLERMISRRRIRHNNPVLSWMMGNAKMIGDGNENVRLSKKKSTGKIDGAVCLVMAVGRWLAGQSENAPSRYESEDAEILAV